MTDEASPLEPYNTISRARKWYHDNRGLEGEGAVGRRHLGWVLEVLYELKNRVKELEKKSEYKLSIREPKPLELADLERALAAVLPEEPENCDWNTPRGG